MKLLLGSGYILVCLFLQFFWAPEIILFKDAFFNRDREADRENGIFSCVWFIISLNVNTGVFGYFCKVTFLAHTSKQKPAISCL